MAKKLMMLGAGANQLPLIKRAVELGLHVITVDYLPDNVGHKYSHQFVNCSTVDCAGVLAVAERLEIDGIVTLASDAAVPTIAYVTSSMGLNGASSPIAKILTNKAQFRQFQRQHGLSDHVVS